MRHPLKIRLALTLIRALGRLPLSVNHALGALIGSLLYYLPNKARRDARVNLALCLPELDSAERKRLLRRSLQEIAKTATEVAYFWTRPPDRVGALIQEVTGPDPHELLARGKGLVVALPHLGAWEVMGLYWAQRLRVHALYRPPKNAEFEALLTAGRGRGGAILLPATPSGIRRLYQALQDKHTVAILPDQEPPGQGEFAPFFGQPAKTMTLLPKLARRSGAPVLFAFAERLPRGRGYRVHLLPAPDGVADADPVVAATALNAGVERCIRMAPEQYQWSYRRFRRRPDRGPNPYQGAPL